MTETSRSIDIVAERETCSKYLADPANLVEWTKFYISVLGRDGGKVKFKTQAGDCTSEIVVQHLSEQTNFRINSQFPGKSETALMTLSPQTGHQLFTFFFQFPNGLPAAARKAMLVTLEKELITLKGILEAKDGSI